MLTYLRYMDMPQPRWAQAKCSTIYTCFPLIGCIPVSDQYHRETKYWSRLGNCIHRQKHQRNSENSNDFEPIHIITSEFIFLHKNPSYKQASRKVGTATYSMIEVWASVFRMILLSWFWTLSTRLSRHEDFEQSQWVSLSMARRSTAFGSPFSRG
jgi:hypothetical protein